MTRAVKLRVQLITKPDSRPSGTTRYAAALAEGAQRFGMDVQCTYGAKLPAVLDRSASLFGWDACSFFGSYPLRAARSDADIVHLTSQTLATLLRFQSFQRPVVVTVHDIIPHLVRHDPQLNTLRHPLDRFFYAQALAGLRHADAIIAVSEHTKRTLVGHLQLPAERIHVVAESVDARLFRPLPVPAGFLAQRGLSAQCQYILYVGSDDPRKNLTRLLQAFARVRMRVRAVKLLLVGMPLFDETRAGLARLVTQLGLEGEVLCFSVVSDEVLAMFYNVAAVFAFPSLHEGFGLPLLEALACGTRAVCSDLGSPPEIAAAGALQVDVTNEDALVEALCAQLDAGPSAAYRATNARTYAERFSLECMMNGVLGVYSALVKEHGA